MSEVDEGGGTEDDDEDVEVKEAGTCMSVSWIVEFSVFVATRAARRIPFRFGSAESGALEVDAVGAERVGVSGFVFEWADEKMPKVSSPHVDSRYWI